MAGLVLKLFGDFAAADASGTALDLSTRKGRALLAVLAVGPAAGVSREKLAGLLWSDRGDQQARSNLRQTLVVLRKELGNGFFDGDDERLALRDTASDVEAFGRLAGSRDRGDLQRAASLVAGEFFADGGIGDPVFSDWLEGERRRLTAALQDVLTRLLPLEAGAERIALAQRLVSLDPLREASHLALMQAHVEAGDRARALAAYGAARELLKAELGVAPGPDLETYRASLLVPAHKAVADAARPAVKPSLIVLPFANLSGDPSRQYLSDGITEDLISLLGRSSEVSVLTQNAASIPDKPLQLAEIVHALGADYIVRGAARSSGLRMVVSCQLVEGRSGNVMWSERYDGEAADLFGVLDDVVIRIVTALGSRLVSIGASVAGRKPTASWSAYDYFLKGRELCNAGKEWDAEALFARAVELDPQFALAHAWRSFGLLGQFWRDGRAERLESAWASAEKALQNDANDAMCHYAAGTVSHYMLNYERSEDHFRRATALNPLDVNIQGDYAGLLTCRGQYAKALAIIDAVLARDPYPPTWLAFVRGKALFFMGEHAAAARVLEGTRWNYRTHVYLAAAYGHLGQAEQALRQVETARAIHPGVTAEEIRLTAGISDAGMLAHLFDGLRLAGFKD